MSDFNSIAEMMQGCAAEAVGMAHDQFGFVLDYSDSSIQSLETVLANVVAKLDLSDKDAVEQSVKVWGGYFGETIRRSFGGTWDLIQYPGSEFALPTLVIAGSQLYPLMKIYRRLTMGDSENVWSFYQRIRGRLTSTASNTEPSKTV